jgi:anaerobic ribonucleoside-triphosphate reductase
MWTIRREVGREYMKGKGEKGKVVPAHVIKAYTGVEVQLHSALMLAGNGGECIFCILG